MNLNDSDWIQQTVYKILHHHFIHTTNLFDLLQLLKILDSESAVLLFKFEGNYIYFSTYVLSMYRVNICI